MSAKLEKIQGFKHIFRASEKEEYCINLPEWLNEMTQKREEIAQVLSAIIGKSNPRKVLISPEQIEIVADEAYLIFSAEKQISSIQKIAFYLHQDIQPEELDSMDLNPELREKLSIKLKQIRGRQLIPVFEEGRISTIGDLNPIVGAKDFFKGKYAGISTYFMRMPDWVEDLLGESPSKTGAQLFLRALISCLEEGSEKDYFLDWYPQILVIESH